MHDIIKSVDLPNYGKNGQMEPPSPIRHNLKLNLSSLPAHSDKLTTLTPNPFNKQP